MKRRDFLKSVGILAVGISPSVANEQSTRAMMLEMFLNREQQSRSCSHAWDIRRLACKKCGVTKWELYNQLTGGIPKRVSVRFHEAIDGMERFYANRPGMHSVLGDQL